MRKNTVKRPLFLQLSFCHFPSTVILRHKENKNQRLKFVQENPSLGEYPQVFQVRLRPGEAA